MKLYPHLPSGIVCSAGRIADNQRPLFAAEKMAVAAAGSKRMAEFRAGRTCARRALKLLACEDAAIPMCPDRCPGWPDGIVGSITHTTSLAAAIVARDSLFAGLGIDLEEDGALEPELHEILMRPEERQGLPSTIVISSTVVDTAKVVFAVKEAIFKAVFPLTKVRFGFLDASLTFDMMNGSYEAKLHLPISDYAGRSVKGTTGYEAGHVIAIATIPAPHPS